MDNLVVLFILTFLSGLVFGATLWQCFWNKVLIKNNNDWYDFGYDLGYKHGKQRGDADAFFEEVYQKHKD